MKYLKTLFLLSVISLLLGNKSYQHIKVKYPIEQLPCKLCYFDKSLWQVLRQNFKLKQADDDQVVKEYIRNYQANKHCFYTTIERSQMYMHYILAAVLQNDMPAELALLPYVESNNDPFAHSKAGASGLWQMMPSVASTLKLHIDYWKDDRRDILSSTEAALTHLKSLHRGFSGNWEYAISAYNAGQTRVKRAIQQEPQPKKHIWHYSLAQETKQYLPKLLALQAIIANPEKYGFTLPEMKNTPYFSTINLKRNYAFPQIEEICKINPATLRSLNPGWRRQATHGEQNITLLLPYETASRCNAKLNQRNPLQTKNWQHHKVKRGDNLSTLAKKYNTSTENIRSLNGLKGDSIKINQELIIPKNIKTYIPISHLSSKEAIISGDKRPGPVQIIHYVKKTDTLESISKEYRISQEKISAWNHITRVNPITENQRLVLWTRQKQEVYTVKPGDSLYRIAKSHNTTVEKIKSINHLEKDTLKINQKLKLQNYD